MIYIILIIVVIICCAVVGHASDAENAAKRQTEEARKQSRAAERQAVEMQRLARLEESRQAAQLEQASIEARQRAVAKRPEAFVRLFAEEFPGYVDAITYGKAEEALSRYASLTSSDLVLERFAESGDDESAVLADPAVQRLFVRRIAPLVSREFVEYAESFPGEFVAGLVRAARSSATIAGLER